MWFPPVRFLSKALFPNEFLFYKLFVRLSLSLSRNVEPLHLPRDRSDEVIMFPRLTSQFFANSARTIDLLCIDSPKWVCFCSPRLAGLVRLSGPISIIAKLHKKRASEEGCKKEGGGSTVNPEYRVSVFTSFRTFLQT